MCLRRLGPKGDWDVVLIALAVLLGRHKPPSEAHMRRGELGYEPGTWAVLEVHLLPKQAFG